MTVVWHCPGERAAGAGAGRRDRRALAADGARRARRSVAHATPRARWRGLSMRSRDLQAYGRICYNKRTRLSHPFDIDIAHALML